MAEPPVREHEIRSVLSNYGLFNTALDRLSYAARSNGSVSLLKTATRLKCRESQKQLKAVEGSCIDPMGNPRAKHAREFR
jgi:hypothetical protein